MTDQPVAHDAEHLTVHYAGFWVRVACHVIDSLLFMMVALPILISVYGMDVLVKPLKLLSLETDFLAFDTYFLGTADLLVNYVLPVIAVLMFWSYRSATPGKMLLKIRIVDARTLGKPSTRQFVIRYFAYIVSTLPLMLGLFWIAFDPRKQAWHDKLAHTVVIQD